MRSKVGILYQYLPSEQNNLNATSFFLELMQQQYYLNRQYFWTVFQCVFFKRVLDTQLVALYLQIHHKTYHCSQTSTAILNFQMMYLLSAHVSPCLFPSVAHSQYYLVLEHSQSLVFKPYGNFITTDRIFLPLFSGNKPSIYSYLGRVVAYSYLFRRRRRPAYGRGRSKMHRHFEITLREILRSMTTIIKEKKPSHFHDEYKRSSQSTARLAQTDP